MTDFLLLLKFSETAERLLPTINSWLAGRGRLVHDEDPAVPRGWYGGSKYLQASMAFGAAEEVDVEAFIAFLKSLPWAVDDDVNAQLAFRKPGDAAFTLHKILPVASMAYAPAPPPPPLPPRVHVDVRVTLHYRSALGEAFAEAIVRPLAARLKADRRNVVVEEVPADGYLYTFDGQPLDVVSFRTARLSLDGEWDRAAQADLIVFLRALPWGDVQVVEDVTYDYTVKNDGGWGSQGIFVRHPAPPVPNQSSRWSMLELANFLSGTLAGEHRRHPLEDDLVRFDVACHRYLVARGYAVPRLPGPDGARARGDLQP